MTKKTAVKEYVYHPPVTSGFYRHFLSPLCDWLCNNLVPMWVHPDHLTYIGVVCASISTFLVMNDKFFYAALFWMLYSLFDNMDGKQARRTKKSSPGGEYLDHSCDSVVTILAVICWSSAILMNERLEKYRFLWMIIGGPLPYYFSTVAHDAIGRLILGTRVDGGKEYVTVDEFNFIILPSIMMIRHFFPWLLHLPLYKYIPYLSGISSSPTYNSVLSKVTTIVRDVPITPATAIMITCVTVCLIQSLFIISKITSLPNIVRILPIFILMTLSYYFSLYPLEILPSFALLIMHSIFDRLTHRKRSFFSFFTPIIPAVLFALLRQYEGFIISKLSSCPCLSRYSNYITTQNLFWGLFSLCQFYVMALMHYHKTYINNRKVEVPVNADSTSDGISQRVMARRRSIKK